MMVETKGAVWMMREGKKRKKRRHTNASTMRLRFLFVCVFDSPCMRTCLRFLLLIILSEFGIWPRAHSCPMNVGWVTAAHTHASCSISLGHRLEHTRSFRFAPTRPMDVPTPSFFPDPSSHGLSPASVVVGGGVGEGELDGHRVLAKLALLRAIAAPDVFRLLLHLRDLCVCVCVRVKRGKKEWV